MTSSSAWGALTTYPYKLRQTVFLPWGAPAPTAPPLATSMISAASPLKGVRHASCLRP